MCVKIDIAFEKEATWINKEGRKEETEGQVEDLICILEDTELKRV